MTRAEKSARAIEMRGRGMTAREIAAELGISRGYASQLCADPDGAKNAARRDRYRGTCLDCGKPTDGSNGRTGAPTYCRRCAPAHHRGKWSQEKIVAAIQRWAALYGAPPSVLDWNPALARLKGASDLDMIERRWASGDWPYVSSVRSHCGSWNAAIAAAGFTPRGPGKREARRLARGAA